MRCALAGGALILVVLHAVTARALTYDLGFSTYIGGSNVDQLRDIDTDRQGNIYITGGTESSDFPVTAGAYDTTHNGWYDVFVAKFDSSGTLIWATFVGGPNYDRAYGVKVDTLGYVYAAGRAGPGFPVTPGAFQTQFRGYYNGIYGDLNGFVVKLLPDGSDLVWASYFGVSTLIRDFDIDLNGDIYVTSGYEPGQSPDSLPPAWVAGGFQQSPQGGTDGVVAKIQSDGSQVLWATYLGGSGDESAAACIRIDSSNSPYILQFLNSTDAPFSPGAYDTTYNGGWDFFVAKLTPDGSNLLFGTYLGGSQNEFVSTHNIAVDMSGNAYVLAPTSSPDYPTTPGVFQETSGGGPSDVAVSKISADGTQLLLSTFVSGNDRENGDGMAIDSIGDVYFSGDSWSPDFPVTPDAYQSYNAGGQDGILVKLSQDFTQLLYSTYMGGSADDASRSSTLDVRGNFYYAGWTRSSDFPLKNPWQDSLAGDWDVALAKFVPVTAVAEQTAGSDQARFHLHASNPSRQIKLTYSLAQPGEVRLLLYDSAGHKVNQVERYDGAGTHELTIRTEDLRSGVYFAKIEAAGSSLTRKLVLFK